MQVVYVGGRRWPTLLDYHERMPCVAFYPTVGSFSLSPVCADCVGNAVADLKFSRDEVEDVAMKHWTQVKLDLLEQLGENGEERDGPMIPVRFCAHFLLVQI